MKATIAQRRAAKAQRRKQVLTAKRKEAVAASSLPAQVLRYAAGPVHRCLLQDGLAKVGIAILVLAREVPDGGIAVATFLIDGFCLGIKDVTFNVLSTPKFGDFIEAAGEVQPFRDYAPERARKLLWDMARSAAEHGFEPHRDFAVVERFFGDTAIDPGEAEFHYGFEGKPFYIVGPGESPAQVRRRQELARAAQGDDAFALAASRDDYIDGDYAEIIPVEQSGPHDATAVSPG